MCHKNHTRTIQHPCQPLALNWHCPPSSPPIPFQVRAVIATKSGGVGPFEQLTWFYNSVSTAGKACDMMVDETVRDLPSQPDTVAGGAMGPSQEEQVPAYGVSAISTDEPPAMRCRPPTPIVQPRSARPYKRSRPLP